MIKTNLNKIKNYIDIAARAKYVIYGADNLKGYTHKLYLVLYRNDFGKTIQKVLNELNNLPSFMLKVEDFNYITNLQNCKLIAIKNKGLAEQISNYLRSETISG